jgi:hypothetical protein
MENKIHLALKRSAQQKLQEKQVIEDVQRDRINRQQKNKCLPSKNKLNRPKIPEND